jgi:CRP-like cAMP-binding protein
MSAADTSPSSSSSSPSPTAPETEAALWLPATPHPGQQTDALEALRAVPLFAELSTGQLKKVARILHHRTYQPGEVVFREGDPGAGMYLIHHGAVRIVIRLPDGAERELAVLTDRHFFGEMALLEEAPRSASAVAVQRTELLGFFQPDLESLVERDSRLGSLILWNLARLMASRLRATNEAMKAQRQAGSGR